MKLNNTDVYVNVIGDSEKEIIFLHGWGQDSTTFRTIVNLLKDDYKMYVVDLPGFGKSPEPEFVFTLDDYALIVEKIIQFYQIKQPLIIGHSFGGRVAIKHTSLFSSAGKLLLMNSAGIKPKKKMKYYIKVYTYKCIKKVLSIGFLKQYKQKYLNKFGSADYKNASDYMKKVLINAVNEDLSDVMKKVTIPVLLFWGEHDPTTPIEFAHKMKEYFYDSGLVIVKNSGHFSYLDNPYLLQKVIKSFY